jgi:Mn2+/Fe2+ NRAMP family transporter
MDLQHFQQESRKRRILGPGLITGASDDDPSGIATYSQAGADFGFAALGTAIITFPLMAAVQEMCARVGMATEEGLTAIPKKKYPNSISYLMAVLSFPAITLNICADIQGWEPLPIYLCIKLHLLLSA